MSYCRFIFNALLLLLITPGLAVHSRTDHFKSNAYAEEKHDLPITYDGFLKLLQDLENDELGSRYDLDEINHFLVSCARQGLLPSDDAYALELDIAELLSNDDYPGFSFWKESNYFIDPAIMQRSTEIMLCKNIFKTGWQKTKKFVKKNKKPIIIVGAISIAAAAVIGIAAASAAAAAGAATSSDRRSQRKNKSKEAPIPTPSNVVSEDCSLIQSALDNEIVAFKEIIDRQQFLKPQNADFSIEETGRVLGQAFAHQSLDSLQKQAASSPQFYKELTETKFAKNPRSIELVFSEDGFSYSVRNPDLGVEENLYHLRGERALELESYDQAIFDFSKVIEKNPTHSDVYLDRAFAHLYKGNYQEALEDHQVHLSQKPPPSTHLIEFSHAIAKGLTKGAKESGMGLVSFAGDAIVHPIDTAREMWDGCSAFAELVLDEEWETIGKVLSPELHDLIYQWNDLSIDERGELAAHALGKIGTDVFAPAASLKVLSAGVKGSRELAMVCKTFKNAEKTLALESFAQTGLLESVAILENSMMKVMGNSYKSVGEVVVPIKNMDLTSFLNTISEGNWVKVYEAGIKNGSKVEVHYFRNNTNGNIFDAKVKYDYFHQKEFKGLIE